MKGFSVTALEVFLLSTSRFSWVFTFRQLSGLPHGLASTLFEAVNIMLLGTTWRIECYDDLGERIEKRKKKRKKGSTGYHWSQTFDLKKKWPLTVFITQISEHSCGWTSNCFAPLENWNSIGARIHLKLIAFVNCNGLSALKSARDHVMVIFIDFLWNIRKSRHSQHHWT